MIVNSGLSFFPALISAGGANLSFKAKVGTNSTATTAGMTSLLAQVSEDDADGVAAIAGDYNYDVLSVITQHGPGGTYQAKEAGLFINGIMFGRVTGFAEKLSGEYIKTDFKYRFTQDVSDGLRPIVGRDFFPRYCAGGGGEMTVSVKIGTGKTAPSLNDTDIETPVAVDLVPTVSSTGNTLNIAAHFGPSGAYTVEEYGYFITYGPLGTVLQRRWVGPPITKIEGDHITIYLADTFSIL